MFTVEQIKEAHSKVKSGADFPRYIQEIKALGVTAFETWVIDRHTEYFDKDHLHTKSDPMYENLAIANDSDKEKFSIAYKFINTAKPTTSRFVKIVQKQA